jgi:hypothetical protein
MRLVVFALVAGCSFRSPSSGPGPEDGPVSDAPIDASAPLDAQISFVIQAEDATRTDVPVGTAWVTAMTPRGFTGTGVMTLRPDAPAVCLNPLLDLCASLEFDVTIVEARTYHFFVRMYASAGDEDSLHYAIDDAAAVIVDTDEVDPAWRWRGSASAALAPGLHTLHIWARESTLHLDAVALMPSSVPPP